MMHLTILDESIARLAIGRDENAVPAVIRDVRVKHHQVRRGAAARAKINRLSGKSTNLDPVKLKHPPVGVVIRIYNLTTPMANGFGPGEVPIKLCKEVVGGVTRTGLPFVPAVVATDYYAQGTTFARPAIVDLRPPPKSRSLFANYHVCISRFRRLDQMFLLCPLWPSDDQKEKVVKAILRAVRVPASLLDERARLRALATAASAAHVLAV